MNISNVTNYKPRAFAELLGVSVKTLQRWDRDGVLKAHRTPTGRRYYTYDISSCGLYDLKEIQKADKGG